MGCGASFPAADGFLVEHPASTRGFVLGDLASTAAGQVTLRYSAGISMGTPCGMNPTTNPVKDGSGTLLFTVYRAGEPPGNSDFNFGQWRKLIRQPTVLRDAAGKCIALLKSDSIKDPVQPGNVYTGYSAKPPFEGQSAALTFEDVALYAAFKVQNIANRQNRVIMVKDAAGGLEPQPAYMLKTHMTISPVDKFVVTLPGHTKKEPMGVACGDKSGSADHLLTVAKGMDAGVAVMAGFAAALLGAEIPGGNGGGPGSGGGP